MYACTSNVKHYFKNIFLQLIMYKTCVCMAISPLTPAKSMDAASLIPIPLRITQREQSLPHPEQETIWTDKGETEREREREREKG